MRALTDRSLWRRTAAAGAVVLALTGPAGCGSGDDSTALPGIAGGSSDPSGPVAHRAGDRISTEDAVAVVTRATERITTAHMTMDMSTGAAGRSTTVTAEGDVSMNPLAEDMTMSLMGQRMRVIVVDKTMYVQAPGMGTTGDTWMKLDMSDLASMSGMSGTSDALANPLSMIDKLGGAIQGGSYVGSESVGGTKSDHYALRVDTQKLLAAFGSSRSTGTPSLPPTMTEDLWVDDQGRMIRSKVDMGALGTVTMHMSDYGEAVHVQAPPADQVTAMPNGVA